MRGVWLRLSMAICAWALPAATGHAQTAATIPGGVMRDCAECPEMVVVPAGRFEMGSPASAVGRDPDEGPPRTVTLSRNFAVSKFEVTRQQFGQFIRDTGRVAANNCSVWTGTRAERIPGKGWQDTNFPQNDNHPVVCVSWDDAKSYVAWIAKKTGQPYRLLSEAEWEYAARATATSDYSFGDNADDTCQHGNVADLTARDAGGAATWTYANCRDGFGIGTAPVGSFPANAFGLHDLHGNAWEWVEDCYHNSYAGAPSDGSAWTAGECTLHVDRGGGWYNNRGSNRSTERASYPPANNSGNLGLRLARDIP